MSEYQANVDRAQVEADVANRAALRDQTIATQQAQRQEAQARINQQNLDNQGTTYARRMEDITKAGGFEAPTIPPRVDTYTQPADPTQPILIYNMPFESS